MKHIVTIYALADPHTREVRYVGQTRKSTAERLAHHIGAARRGVKRPVYDWIRALAPAEPLLVILQRVDNVWSPKDKSPASTAETKWMKRFWRSDLFNSVDRNCRAYKTLVNR